VEKSNGIRCNKTVLLMRTGPTGMQGCRTQGHRVFSASLNARLEQLVVHRIILYTLQNPLKLKNKNKNIYEAFLMILSLNMLFILVIKLLY
jgi:hypothetical protein